MGTEMTMPRNLLALAGIRLQGTWHKLPSLYNTASNYGSQSSAKMQVLGTNNVSCR
jgi:hypothetical protein